MKKKTVSRKKKKSTSRFGLEILALCILLGVAAYVGDWGQSQPSRPAVSTKAEKNTVRQERKQEAVRVQEGKKLDQRSAEHEKKPSASTKAISNKGVEKSSSENRKSAQPAAPAKSSSSDAEYRLAHAADGDSFELVDDRKRKIRVRLYGVDAPESSQSYGKKSRAHLIKLMEGKKLLLRTMYTDNYQRTVAIVHISRGGKADELSINQQQIQAGMAWVYDYFCTSSVCNIWKLEEAMAQKQKLGLWKEANPVPPWQWRRANSRK